MERIEEEVNYVCIPVIMYSCECVRKGDVREVARLDRSG